ncbi:BTB/POZ and TAZ domain-containing protein 1-like [Wolffia australiana]
MAEEADARVVTSGGRIIPVHTRIVSMASPVLEAAILDRRLKRGNSGQTPPALPILGVPCDAVSAFIKYVYESRCSSEDMQKYAMHLLALSHVYQLPRLKRACVGSLAERLSVDTIIDVLQLARLCDAPRLRVRCMKLLAAEFANVEKTEAWHFLQANDPHLELDILQYLHEISLREKRRARNKKAQSVYMELSEAMECLRHICTEGCTEVGPSDGEKPCQSRGPCSLFRTCQGVQRLIRHFATCERKKTMVPGGGCGQCKRMWQLLRLHAATCDHPDDLCRVPLCHQFKTRAQMGKMGEEDARWGLLVRKVVSARVTSALTRGVTPCL